jgi:hypothetical protein
MPALKLKDVQYETDTWKRRLGFMIEENIHFKNTISDILKENFNKNLLNLLEEFHNRFLKADDWFSFLRNDIAELDELLVREIYEDGKVAKEIQFKLKKIRQDLLTIQQKFDLLKQDFTDFLEAKG